MRGRLRDRRCRCARTMSANSRAGRFGGTQDHRAAAQIPAATAPCSASGAAAQRHAAGLHARNQPVFGDGHQRRIEHAALRGVRQSGR